MTPTEQEIEFFTSEEAKRIQEEWEPRLGDWVRLAPHDLYDFEDGIIVLPADNAEDIVVVRTNDHQHLLLYPNELIWLPRQGQLQAMLEERGYGLAHLGDERLHPDFDGRDWNPDEPYIAIAEREGWGGEYVKGLGPTPCIALGRALIGVLEEQE